MNTTSVLLWRINPKQCDYTKLKPDQAWFSTSGLNLVKAKLVPGNLIIAQSSNDGKANILGIWQVLQKPQKRACDGHSAIVHSFKGQFKKVRQYSQWRVSCALVYGINEMNDMNIMIKNIVSPFKQRQKPTVLPSKIASEICALLPSLLPSQ